MSFTLHYQPLSETYPAWGRVTIIPWDTEIFGFAVGDYEAGDANAVRSDLDAWQAAFDTWTNACHIRLVSCSVAGDALQWIMLLPRLGFALVDYSLRVSLAPLQTTKLPPARSRVELAEPGDQSAIDHIATTAFRFGRYHTDPRMPPELAARRYKHWIGNAFTDLQSNRIYVLRRPNGVAGFFHLVIEDGAADLRLAATDVNAGGIAGYNLYISTFHALQQDGVKRAASKCSAANTAVINLFATCGFKFANPQATFHFHG